jgi:hypothetical protein
MTFEAAIKMSALRLENKAKPRLISLESYKVFLKAMCDGLQKAEISLRRVLIRYEQINIGPGII